MFFGAQFRVEPLGGALFLGGHRFGPGIEPTKTHFGAAQHAAIKPQAILRQPGEEGAIMADDDQCATAAIKPVFQPFDGADIQMVGWLIQQQQVGRFGQHTHQRGAATFAARCRGSGAGEIEPDLIGQRRHFVRLRAASQHIVFQSFEVAHRRILFQPADLQPAGEGAPALIRFDAAVDDLQQRGFAGAVAADQGDTVACIKGERQALEQPTGAVLQSDRFKSENGFGPGRGHGGGSGLSRRGWQEAAVALMAAMRHKITRCGRSESCSCSGRVQSAAGRWVLSEPALKPVQRG